MRLGLACAKTKKFPCIFLASPLRREAEKVERKFLVLLRRFSLRKEHYYFKNFWLLFSPPSRHVSGETHEFFRIRYAFHSLLEAGFNWSASLLQCFFIMVIFAPDHQEKRLISQEFPPARGFFTIFYEFRKTYFAPDTKLFFILSTRARSRPTT
jgi:hypothetical protein